MTKDETNDKTKRTNSRSDKAKNPHKMTVRERWKRTALHNKLLVILTAASLVVYVIYTGNSIVQTMLAQSHKGIDRPWLAIEVAPDGPITFAANGQANFPIKFTAYKSSGNIPANKAHVAADIVFPKVGDFITEPINRRDEICNRSANSYDPFGFGTVFAKPVEFETTFIVQASVMAEQLASLSAGGQKFIGPSLVGCVTYTFEIEGQEFTGKTAFVYDILRTVPGRPKNVRFIPFGENVPEDEISVQKLASGEFSK
ncbi:MAG TPA: hypothetical protein VNY07_02175 [Chthoniobacterales bacterium]|jgi:hypothetical protein|nr:hypothetical protein [Chthoniobacterales bacterium]